MANNGIMFQHQHNHEVALSVNYPIALEWMLWGGFAFFVALTLLALFTFAMYAYYSYIGAFAPLTKRSKIDNQGKNVTLPVINIDRK
jgi:hypothetical protein